MEPMAEMIARFAQPGRVAWIGVRPERRADMRSQDRVEVRDDGVQGDHGRPGKRAVTLVQAEHLAAIGAYLGRGAVQPSQLRRNFVVEGINLASLKGREVQVGQAVMRITGLCAPCSRMEETFGPGGYAAVRGHGGWCAEVVHAGTVRMGDAVRPVD